MTEKYKRLVRVFLDGDTSLAKMVLDQAIRHGDFEIAQRALNCLRTGAPPNPLVIKTVFEEGGRILSYIRGPKGAIQFLMLGYITPNDPLGRVTIMGADVGYHSFEPTWEDQEPMGECEILGGAVCYYDGSGLRASNFLPHLFEGGQETLEQFLMEEYEEMFGDQDE